MTWRHYSRPPESKTQRVKRRKKKRKKVGKAKRRRSGGGGRRRRKDEYEERVSQQELHEMVSGDVWANSEHIDWRVLQHVISTTSSLFHNLVPLPQPRPSSTTSSLFHITSFESSLSFFDKFTQTFFCKKFVSICNLLRLLPKRDLSLFACIMNVHQLYTHVYYYYYV